MGALVFDTVTKVEQFVTVFITLYAIVILAYIVLSWVRLPYSPWLNRIQRFLYDVCEPYLRLFRRILPPFGALDLSPMIAVLVLYVIRWALLTALDQLH
jgi:uncharacterized protein YggT (Ycf19 family)